MEKKSRGRPKVREDAAKSTPVQIRMTEAEKAAFNAAAELAGISLSAWMRERLRTASRKELRDAGRDVPFLVE
jgi:predicted HicB family RNase H-like nuclease